MADLVRRRRGAAGGRAQPQHVGQRQAGAEGADLEEVAPRHAVAEALLGTPDREHGTPLVLCFGRRLSFGESLLEAPLR